LDVRVNVFGDVWMIEAGFGELKKGLFVDLDRGSRIVLVVMVKVELLKW